MKLKSTSTSASTDALSSGGSNETKVNQKSATNSVYDKAETLKLMQHISSKSVPSMSLNNDDIAIIDEDDEEYHDDLRNLKTINNLQNAKSVIRKLSHSNNVTATKDGRLPAASKSHFEFASTAHNIRMLNKDISKTKVNLTVENLIIISKLNDMSILYLNREMIAWILTQYPSTNVYVQDIFKDSEQFAANELCTDSNCTLSRIRYWNKEFVEENDFFFDLCITLGGDGTVLFASSLFQKYVPPTISFALGSLGFLTNFDFEDFKSILRNTINHKIKTNLRMRLHCKVYRRHKPKRDPSTGKKICYVELVDEHHVLNEVTIDRGPSPFISNLELYGDGCLMTVAQADGLIIATPTGSTAYSLSAGGSLIYPTVNAIAVTPVCPHTLSFRPIVLPESCNLKVKVATQSRGTSWASFDGKGRVELRQGDFITVSASPYAFQTVQHSNTEFIDSISRLLNWNVREQQKSFTHMLSDKNKKKFAEEFVLEEKEDDELIEVRKIGEQLFSTLELGKTNHSSPSTRSSSSSATAVNTFSTSTQDVETTSESDSEEEKDAFCSGNVRVIRRS
ncbi:hypothetical protein KAFR_0E00490 [Kazachstania africana CBS 2517]|uniref:NAD+ kinase n=1 Tax=Kazachstania africana (strain ATCC 22294 / BCRC 22015 / CBS 2517 / CECT 1963 / NBRC 1671 / NRRL Y-8276) TaxID=1071382 RepID=H2AV03_KAZAF|nr:hypothetical protein KAFR_0E00490 [Kazachstania africana CBS 2517]CCF58203.1 hypothetical protein KAFR_0E00490 [Kazachstania africana CBS 2517]